ncbi:MAG: FAD-binding protein [Chitinivibrionales bacterium]|nr:FAD-binding protein [Chitinivibrionales bacterium]
MKDVVVTIECSVDGSIRCRSFSVHTLVIGSGAAGLNAALQLRARGIDDILVLTEGLDKGTSINTGSDKQTYYKLGMCGVENDSPLELARSYFDGGGMHGDLALVEASVSPRAFINLVNLGVPFPQDRYGRFVGYKTDHDPRRRATSAGPYTSQQMCRALIGEIRRLNIPIVEKRDAVKLLTLDENGSKRAVGVIAINREENDCTKRSNLFEVYYAENVVFAVGGPGGLYATSVYPAVHTGAIGLALMEGAWAQNLPESQYGMASTKFRWNVSGTFMQVIPRFISTAPDGSSDPQEFLAPFFDSPGEMNSMIFLKGYQWPFDPRKIIRGSSIIDIAVYIETTVKKRRVFLDFRENSAAFDCARLSSEARDYLEKSGALSGTPISRLQKMNPQAVRLYADQGIDIGKEPLEIAVCAQHNNGGLAGNLWWESINIKHLFPIGEVNGSHGIYRPGGSALNAGQVGGFRAAEYIKARYAQVRYNRSEARKAAEAAFKEIFSWMKNCRSSSMDTRAVRDEFQKRMSRAGAHVRSRDILEKAVKEARVQWNTLQQSGSKFAGVAELAEAFRNRRLCFTHSVYLESVLFALQSGVGSRGSSLVINSQGTAIHAALDDTWRFQVENSDFREKVLYTRVDEKGTIHNEWRTRRPLPETEPWFEIAWAEFRDGVIYRDLTLGNQERGGAG